MSKIPSNSSFCFPSEVFSVLAQAESGFWWFESRNVIILWTLKRFVPRLKSFLEIGCGTGFVLQKIRKNYPNADLTGAEFFEEGLIHARKRIPDARFEKLDATQMSQTEVFDAIGAFDVIEHIENDKLVLNNLRRALKPGGRLFITVPQHSWLWSKTDERAGHFRRYSYRELTKKVKESGFEIEYSTSFVFFLVPLMWISRVRAIDYDGDPMAEFRISPFLNFLFKFVMKVELFLIQSGFRFCAGGSRILVVRRNDFPTDERLS